MFNEISIVGLGFMGASLAGAVKKKFPETKITGYDIDKNNLDYCIFNGIIDEALDMSKETAPRGSFIIMCIPPAAIFSFFERRPDFFTGASIVTDIGSVKAGISSIAAAKNIKNFIGSHPMCGSDKSGPKNADFSLFNGKKCFVIQKDADLNDKEKASKIERTADFWNSLNMDVIFSSAENHDEIAAYTSHLPHLIAFLLSDAALSRILDENKNNGGKNNRENENTGDKGAGDVNISSLMSFIGSGFKDSTRIADSSPELWTEILLMNAENVIDSLDNFINSANKVRGFIETGDAESLNSYIKKISDERKEAGI